MNQSKNLFHVGLEQINRFEKDLVLSINNTTKYLPVIGALDKIRLGVAIYSPIWNVKSTTFVNNPS